MNPSLKAHLEECGPYCDRTWRSLHEHHSEPARAGREGGDQAIKGEESFHLQSDDEAGETDGFSGKDFLDVLEKYLGKNVLDFAIFNDKRPPERLLRKYRREGAEFVVPPPPSAAGRKPRYILGDFIDTDKFVRHGPLRKIGKLLISL